MHCSECGKVVPDAAKFCPACGTAVHSATAMPASKAEPPRDNRASAWAGFFLILGAIYLVATCAGGDDKKAADPKAVAAAAEEQRKGFHCLSKLDGSNRSLVDQVKAQLRDPDSFEPIETRITPADNGQHHVTMRYRAKNGFGGYNVSRATAKVDHASCEATLISAG